MTFPVSPGYGGRQAAVFQQRAVDDGGVYYPNSIPPMVDTLQRFGIYGDASLVMIPAAVKASVLYSLKPTNGNGDFAVTRNSVACGVNEDLKLENVAVNVARLDYIDGVSALLLEPQRTNLITYPITFSNAYWTKSGCSVVSGKASPSVDYVTSAFKLVEDDQDSTHYITKSLTVSNNVVVSLSIRAKKDGRTWIRFEEIESGDGYYFDLDNGVIGTAIGTVDSYSIKALVDGWWDISITVTVPSTTAEFRIGLADADNSNSYQGDDASGVYIYGAQLEDDSSYPTSLTYAGSEGSTVTRIADVVNGAGQASTFNSVEGVLYAEIAALEDGNSDVVTFRISLSDGTTTNRIILFYDDSDNPNRIIAAVVVNGSTVASMSYDVTSIADFHKVALKWKVDDFALWIDGVERATDLSGASFPASTIDQLRFEDGDGGLDFYGKTKALGVFNRALSDNELEDLTT